MRRIISLIIILCLLTTTLVSADPINIDDSKWIVSSKINSHSRQLDNNYRGQYGLFYNLYHMTLMSRWIEFAIGSTDLQFSDQEIEMFESSIRFRVEKFNEKYFVEGINSESLNYKPLYLPLGDNLLDGLVEISTSVIPNYLEEILTEMVAEMNSLGSDRVEFLNRNKESLRFIYRILQVLSSEETEMLKLTNRDFVPVSSSVRAREVLNNQTFIELLVQGQNLSREEQDRLDNISYRDASTFIEQLAMVRKKPNIAPGEFGVDIWEPIDGVSSGYKLSSVYFAIIAASSVYVPFKSYVGDADYIDVLTDLIGPDANKVIRLYNEVKDFKKPLFTVDYAGWKAKLLGGMFSDATTEEATFPTYAGQGEMLSLYDFMKRIENGTLSGYVVHRGNFRNLPEDVNAYGYFRSNEGVLRGFSSPTQTAIFDQEEGPNSSEDINNIEDPHSESIISVSSDKMNTTEWSSTIFEFGEEDGYPIVGLALMKNYIKSLQGLSNLGDTKKIYLFLNPFGDIVTEDNLVIVPAAANPMYYDAVKGYNPYTVAFMNGYPTISNSSKQFTINKRLASVDPEYDIGKYVLVSTGEDINSDHMFLRIRKESSVSIWKTPEPINIYREFIDTSGEKSSIQILKRSTLGVSYPSLNIFSDFPLLQTSLEKKLSDSRMIGIHRTNTYDGVSVFKYYPEEDVDNRVAKLIARNMYWSYVGDGEFNGRLREDFIFRNVLVEGMGGTVYASSYVRSMVETYDNLTRESFGRFKVAVSDFTKETLNNLGDRDGILGLKSSYQDPILGSFMVFIEDYFIYLFILLSVIFIIHFLRMRVNLVYTLFMLTFSGVLLFTFVKVVPVYLPSVYNLLVNNPAKNMSYQILAIKSEKYGDTYRSIEQTRETGDMVINTTSVNLYRLAGSDFEEISSRYGILERDLKSGISYVLDDNVGLYIEGNNLKVTVDSLFQTNPIVGRYVETDVGPHYQFSAQKLYSSSLDYYTPYYLIVDGFVDTLNRLLDVYRIPRHATTYVNGITKDSFIVYNYTNSVPFLSPDDFELLEEETIPEEVEKLKAVFSNPNDILNLDAILSNPTREVRESLWYRTLQQNGILENERRYWKFIGDVNYHTKKFLIDMGPQISLMSDDNLIKMVALHATTIFNQKASEPGNWLYPISLNYQEYTLKDVVLAAFTNDYNRFISSDLDVVNYILDTTGVFTLIMFLFCIFLIDIINHAVAFLIPILYLLFCLLLIYRLLSGSKIRPLVSGYLKASILSFGSYTLLVICLGVTLNFSIRTSLLLLIGVCLLILFVLFQIITSILFNFTELGNSTLNAKIASLADRTSYRNWLNNLRVSTTNIAREVGISSEERGVYHFESSIDGSEELIGTSYIPYRRVRRREVERQEENLDDRRYIRDLEQELARTYRRLDELDNYKH